MTEIIFSHILMIYFRFLLFCFALLWKKCTMTECQFVQHSFNSFDIFDLRFSVFLWKTNLRSRSLIVYFFALFWFIFQKKRITIEIIEFVFSIYFDLFIERNALQQNIKSLEILSISLFTFYYYDDRERCYDRRREDQKTWLEDQRI